jgi:tetratricopeptide (TPR) repeat protein
MKQSLRIILGIQLLLFFACSNESKDNSSLILKGIKLQENEQHEEAIELFEKILSNEPDSTTELYALNMITYSYDKLGDYYEEISWAEKLTEKYPNKPDGFISLAKGFQGLEKFDIALENYWTATQLDTGVTTPFTAAILADNYTKPEVAIKFYQECIKRDSQFNNAFNNITIDLFNIKDFENAKNYCEILVRLNPNDQKVKELYQDILSNLK